MGTRHGQREQDWLMGDCEGPFIDTEEEMRESLQQAFKGTSWRDRITVIQHMQMHSPFGELCLTVEVVAKNPDEAFDRIRQKLDGAVIR